jgi:carboxyl-terminal processing protease
MRETQTEQPASVESNQRRLTWRSLLIGVLIFAAGTVVGSGRVQFGHSLGSTNPELPNSLDYSSVDKVYDALRQNYDGKLTEAQLLDGLKSGLAEATNDPYTEYFTAKEAEVFDDQLNNSFSGVGAELSKDKDDNLIVVAPISGFPAEKAGLKAGDIILAIDTKTTSGLSVDEAVQTIRGKADTEVKLTVLRQKTERLDITITRQNIRVPSVSYKVLADGVGYVRITTFAADTGEKMAAAASALKGFGVRGLVLDLRDNPGGRLDAAVQVASQWLPEGTLVLQEKRGSVPIQTYKAEGTNPLRGIPTVVLINGGSASASEIVAGALHDNKAATLIGQKSFGKGVVQQLICLGAKPGLFSGTSDAAQDCKSDVLKVTVASWYRPNGQNINKQGIKPDKAVEPGKNDSPTTSDAQKQAAIDFLLSRR